MCGVRSLCTLEPGCAKAKRYFGGDGETAWNRPLNAQRPNQAKQADREQACRFTLQLFVVEHLVSLLDKIDNRHMTPEVLSLEGVIGINSQDVPAKEICPGIRKRDLWLGVDGAKAQIVEIDAGATFTSLDTHSGAEEIFVVSGVFGDGAHEYAAGSFIHNPAGSSHVPQSKTGCVIFVFSPQAC